MDKGSVRKWYGFFVSFKKGQFVCRNKNTLLGVTCKNKDFELSHTFLMKKIFNYTLILLLIGSAHADAWVDEDGGAIVDFDEESVSIFSLDSFFYFDQIFAKSKEKNSRLNICFGFADDNTSKMGSDCYKENLTLYSVHNSGKNRAIHVLMPQKKFLRKSFHDYLNNGLTMKVSIDDGYMYATYILHKDYKLNEEAKQILELPD